MMTRHTTAGPLRNARHERMAQSLAEGATQEAAYVEAGYSKNSARQSASALLKLHPEILGRRNELLEERERARSGAVAQAAEELKITETRTLSEAAAIGFSDPRLLFDENGDIKAPQDWPDHLAAAVASIEVDALFDGHGKDRKQIGYTKKVRFWDKNSALEKLMRHLGMFDRDNHQRNQSPLAQLPPQQQHAIYSQLLQFIDGEPEAQAQSEGAKAPTLQ